MVQRVLLSPRLPKRQLAAVVLHVRLSLTPRRRTRLCRKIGSSMALHVKCLVSGFDGAENVQKVDFHEVSNAFTTIERRQSFHFEERCHSRFSAAGGSRAFRWQASGFQHFSGSSCQCVTFLSSSPVLGDAWSGTGAEFQLCLCTKS